MLPKPVKNEPHAAPALAPKPREICVEGASSPNCDGGKINRPHKITMEPGKKAKCEDGYNVVIRP